MWGKILKLTVWILAILNSRATAKNEQSSYFNEPTALTLLNEPTVVTNDLSNQIPLNPTNPTPSAMNSGKKTKIPYKSMAENGQIVYTEETIKAEDIKHANIKMSDQAIKEFNDNLSKISALLKCDPTCTEGELNTEFNEKLIQALRLYKHARSLIPEYDISYNRIRIYLTTIAINIRERLYLRRPINSQEKIEVSTEELLQKATSQLTDAEFNAFYADINALLKSNADDIYKEKAKFCLEKLQSMQNTYTYWSKVPEISLATVLIGAGTYAAKRSLDAWQKSMAEIRNCNNVRIETNLNN